MNKDEKLTVLKKFISDLDAYSANEVHRRQIKPEDIDCSTLPEIDLLGDLMGHHDQIMAGVDSTYKAVQPVLKELNLLQSQKQNVNDLLDSMTSIREVKRFSYGLGSSPTQIYKNLTQYYQTRNKVYYCDKFINRVQEEIKKVEKEFQQILTRELKKSNSQNLTEIAKTLNLITINSSSDNNGNSNSNSKKNQNQHLVSFYLQLLKKELLKFEDDLLKIPIVGNPSTYSSNNYLFFDIAKDIMKCVVTLISTYKNNIVKIGGEETLHHVIVNIFTCVMDGIIMEVFMREKKYFEIDGIEPKKIDKASNKFKQYFKEFCAISNQVQRLKIHVAEQLPDSYPNYKQYLQDLDAAINSSNIIALNSEVIQLVKASTRSQFNKLLKKSNFVSCIWQFDFEFLENIVVNSKKNQNRVYESQEGHDFLIKTYTIFADSIERSLETLNVLIISSIISFANNNLIQEDSFHAFNELFDRLIARFPSAEAKYITGIIIVVNSLLLMPNALRNSIVGITIPSQLEEFRRRLSAQLNELVEVCEFKMKGTINSFFSTIMNAEWFGNELRADYKKCLEKWKGFSNDAYDDFLSKVSKIHAEQIIRDEFNAKKSSKLLTQQGIINYEKQVRQIISFYEENGCPIHANFDKILAYIELLLTENEEGFKRLLKNLEISDEKEIDMIQILKANKLN